MAGLPFPNDKGQHIFLGYSAMLLSVLGAVGAGAPQPGIGLAVGPELCCSFSCSRLGPTVRWAGQDTGVPGPFALVSQLPFFSGNRYPSRYSVMLMLAVAVLAGFGLVWLLAWGRGRGRAGRRTDGPLAVIAALFGGLFIFEHLATPLPLSDFRVPAIYQRLAQEPGDFAILELPTGWRNGARVLGKADLLIMMQQWWQTEHGKRRLGGNTSRNPEYKFQYFTQAPLLGDLIALMNADRPHIGAVVDAEFANMVAKNRPRAGQILRDLGIRTILVHEEKATPQLLSFVHAALPVVEVDRWQGEDGAGEPATIVRYAVNVAGAAAGSAPFRWPMTSRRFIWAKGGRRCRPPTACATPRAPKRCCCSICRKQGGRLSLDWQGPAQTLEDDGQRSRGGSLQPRLPGGGRRRCCRPVSPISRWIASCCALWASRCRRARWRSRRTVALAHVGDDRCIPAAPQVGSSCAAPAKKWAILPTSLSMAAMSRRRARATIWWRLMATGVVLDSAVFDTSGDDAASAAHGRLDSAVAGRHDHRRCGQ